MYAADGGGFSYGPPKSTIRVKRKTTEGTSRAYSINLLRSFFGFKCFLYAILIVILYSAAYIFLPIGRGYKSDLRTVLMLWNSFKPLGALVVAYCCTQRSMPLWQCLVYGSFVGSVFLGTFFYLLILSYDYASCNEAHSDADNSCHDPLYCCVHHSTALRCLDKGPCLMINVTSNRIPISNDTPGGVLSGVKEDDLTANPNFVLAYWLFVVAFVLESLLLYMFFIVLNSINSGMGLFLDTNVNYSYPVFVGKNPSSPKFNPYLADTPTSYQDEIIGGQQQKRTLPMPIDLDREDRSMLMKMINKNNLFRKGRCIFESFKTFFIGVGKKIKGNLYRVYHYVSYSIKELFVLHSESKMDNDNNNNNNTNDDTIGNLVNDSNYRRKPRNFFKPESLHGSDTETTDEDYYHGKNTSDDENDYDEDFKTKFGSYLEEKVVTPSSTIARRNPGYSTPGNTVNANQHNVLSPLPFTELTAKRFEESFGTKRFM